MKAILSLTLSLRVCSAFYNAMYQLAWKWLRIFLWVVGVLRVVLVLGKHCV